MSQPDLYSRRTISSSISSEFVYRYCCMAVRLYQSVWFTSAPASIRIQKTSSVLVGFCAAYKSAVHSSVHYHRTLTPISTANTLTMSALAGRAKTKYSMRMLRRFSLMLVTIYFCLKNSLSPFCPSAESMSQSIASFMFTLTIASSNLKYWGPLFFTVGDKLIVLWLGDAQPKLGAARVGDQGLCVALGELDSFFSRSCFGLLKVFALKSITLF